MNSPSRFRFIVAGLLLAAFAGCKADTITEPRQVPAPPVPPGLGIVVSVSSSSVSVAGNVLRRVCTQDRRRSKRTSVSLRS